MMTYFDIIPEELNYIILSYLEYDEVDDISGILISTLSYEELFKIVFPTEYKDIKEIFILDKSLNKYKDRWDILYKDYLNRNIMTDRIYYKKDSYPSFQEFNMYNPIFYNIFYTVKLFKDYPQWGWVKDRLTESKKILSDYLAFYIVQSLDIYQNRRIYIDPIIKDKTLNGLCKYQAPGISLYHLMIFIFIDEPNFGMTIDELIDEVDLGEYHVNDHDYMLVMKYDCILLHVRKYAIKHKNELLNKIINN